MDSSRGGRDPVCVCSLGERRQGRRDTRDLEEGACPKAELVPGLRHCSRTQGGPFSRDRLEVWSCRFHSSAVCVCVCVCICVSAHAFMCRQKTGRGEFCVGRTLRLLLNMGPELTVSSSTSPLRFFLAFSNWPVYNIFHMKQLVYFLIWLENVACLGKGSGSPVCRAHRPDSLELPERLSIQ